MTIGLIEDDDPHISPFFPITSINFGLQKECFWKVRKVRKWSNKKPSNLSSHSGVSCHLPHVPHVRQYRHGFSQPRSMFLSLLILSGECRALLLNTELCDSVGIWQMDKHYSDQITWIYLVNHLSLINTYKTYLYASFSVFLKTTQPCAKKNDTAHNVTPKGFRETQKKTQNLLNPSI